MQAVKDFFFCLQACIKSILANHCLYPFPHKKRRERKMLVYSHLQRELLSLSLHCAEVVVHSCLLNGAHEHSYIWVQNAPNHKQGLQTCTKDHHITPGFREHNGRHVRNSFGGEKLSHVAVQNHWHPGLCEH